MPHPSSSVQKSAGKSRFAPAIPRPSPHSRPHILQDAKDQNQSPSRSFPLQSGKVRVIARVRPFLPAEIERHGSTSCISFSDEEINGTILHIQDPISSREGYYKVDACYGERDEMGVIFAKEVKAILPALLHGQNATVFACGATGSGKTYTMQGQDDQPGLMHLAMSNLIPMAEETKFQVQVSYYEVYKERCYDLLEDKCTEVTVLEDSDGKIQLRGLSQVLVRSLLEFKELFGNGCLRRKAGHTGLNDVSSRSHGVLMISIKNVESGTVVGKLNLIDLAGNEDNRKTGNDGVRLVESSSINQSLFALSNVINALNSNEPRVPYRDSKLTRILQDSLGGKTRSIMIACLNPRSYHEAAYTLSLATRSRQISSQNFERKDPQKKVFMEEKSHPSCESKVKTSPSMVPRVVAKGKPLFHTPSHHQINQMRRMMRDIPKDTPKARRLVIMHQPNFSNRKEKKTYTTQALSQEVEQEGVLDKETPSLFPHISSSVENDDNSNENLNNEIAKERTLEEESSSVSTNTEIDKENDRHRYSLTPNVKTLIHSSSPPLSERLHSLRSAMRDILHPVHQNSPPENNLSSAMGTESSSPLESTQETPAMVRQCPLNSPQETAAMETQSQLKSPLEDATMESQSSLKSPLETSDCARKVDEERDANVGTPLAKLNHKSSAIKNSIAREYIAFLNTASREELLELKGIGEKRASYILSLREDTPEPIKEIEDLEKIGITKKQAMSLFKHTARHILFA